MSQRTTIDFDERLDRGERPIPYAIVETHLGWRAFGIVDVSHMTGPEATLADGSSVADGSITAGEGIFVLSADARVKDFGNPERTILPVRTAILSSYTMKQEGSISLTLVDPDGAMSRLVAQEPLLGKELQLRLGFPDEMPSLHLSIFSGKITGVKVTRTSVVISVEEQ